MTAAQDAPALMFCVNGTPRALPRRRQTPLGGATPPALLWRAEVERAIQQMMRHSGRPWWIGGAVEIDMVFAMPTPRAGRWGQPHLARPGKNGLERMVLDCLRRAGALPNGHGRAAPGTTTKVWAEEGGVYVIVRPAAADRPTHRPAPREEPAPPRPRRDRYETERARHAKGRSRPPQLFLSRD